MLNQDYKEMLQILQNQDVDFILVGAKQVKIEDISLNILSIEDLIKNKEATGRPKDIEDANRLKNQRNKS